MSKYSDFFLLTSPEYEELGDKLRLRKYGSWLAEEAWLREKQSQQRAQFTLQTIHLARRIARAKNISEEDAFQLLQGSSAERTELFAEYSEDTVKLLDSLPSGKEQFEELVTVFFRNRGEVDTGKKWQATEDWTKEDTNKLPEPYLRQVEAFMAAEESRADDTDEDEDASEKKPL